MLLDLLIPQVSRDLYRSDFPESAVCANFARYSGCSDSSSGFTPRLKKRCRLLGNRRTRQTLAELAYYAAVSPAHRGSAANRRHFPRENLVWRTLTVLTVVRVNNHFFDSTGCTGRSCSLHWKNISRCDKHTVWALLARNVTITRLCDQRRDSTFGMCQSIAIPQ